MARMPGATWIGPTPNMHPNGMTDHHGLVLHIQQGTEQGSEAWFKNPVSQASAHFLNPKAGGLRQLVDTSDRAWAEMAGNYHWVSVENEGLSGQSLTASQVENAAQLVAWLHKVHAMPLQSTDDPTGTGLGWHGMGGNAWGGHFDCPGDPIKAQRGAILARAKAILSPPAPKPTPTPVPTPVPALSKEPKMLMITVDRTTVPKGTTWPGVFVVLESSPAIVIHVATPADEAKLTAKDVPGPITVTYARYQELLAGK